MALVMDAHAENRQTTAAEDARATLKRLLEHGTDEELARVHKKLTRKGVNVCAAKDTPSSTWRPKSIPDTRLIIDLLKSDVGLRIADATYNVPSNERSMKVVCSDVVERLRFHKGLVGPTARAATSGLSLAVASVVARVVEEANAASNSNSVLVEKNGRNDAPSWGSISAKGSGCSLNVEGYDAFKRALVVVESKVSVIGMDLKT